MEQYEVYDTIGQGAFASCQLVRRKTDGRLLVLKTMRNTTEEMSQQEKEDIVNEVRVLADLNHPNIIQYVGSFVSLNQQHIVMEWAAGGSLGTLIKAKNAEQGQVFAEDQIWEWFAQMCIALQYVHRQHILHRDIKPQNILLWGTDKRVIKLADFGIAKVLKAERNLAATLVGTPYYLSPELCEGRKYDAKSDVWALGCVLYELMALQKPFNGENIPSLVLAITRGKVEDMPPHALEYSPALHDLVHCLLNVDAHERPSMDELCEIPAVKHRIQLWNAIQDAVIEVEAESAQRDADEYILERRVQSGDTIIPPSKASEGLSSPRGSVSLSSPRKKRTFANQGKSALERHSVVSYTTGTSPPSSRRKATSPFSMQSSRSSRSNSMGRGSAGKTSRGSGVSSQSRSSSTLSSCVQGVTCAALNSMSEYDRRVMMTRYLMDVSRVYRFGSGQRNPVLDDRYMRLNRGDICLNVERIAGPRFLSIDDERTFSIIVCEEGEVFSHGDNSNGCLGYHTQGPRGGGVSNSRTTKLLSYFVEREIKIAATAAGDTHCVAVSTDGKVYVWGDLDNAGGRDGLQLKKEIANAEPNSAEEGTSLSTLEDLPSFSTGINNAFDENFQSLRAVRGSDLSEAPAAPLRQSSRRTSGSSHSSYQSIEEEVTFSEDQHDELDRDTDQPHASWPEWARQQQRSESLSRDRSVSVNEVVPNINPFASPRRRRSSTLPLDFPETSPSTRPPFVMRSRTTSTASEDKFTPEEDINESAWPSWARSKQVNGVNPFSVATGKDAFLEEKEKEDNKLEEENKDQDSPSSMFNLFSNKANPFQTAGQNVSVLHTRNPFASATAFQVVGKKTESESDSKKNLRKSPKLSICEFVEETGESSDEEEEEADKDEVDTFSSEESSAKVDAGSKSTFFTKGTASASSLKRYGSLSGKILKKELKAVKTFVKTIVKRSASTVKETSVEDQNHESPCEEFPASPVSGGTSPKQNEGFLHKCVSLPQGVFRHYTSNGKPDVNKQRASSMTAQRQYSFSASRRDPSEIERLHKKLLSSKDAEETESEASSQSSQSESDPAGQPQAAAHKGKGQASKSKWGVVKNVIRWTSSAQTTNTNVAVKATTTTTTTSFSSIAMESSEKPSGQGHGNKEGDALIEVQATGPKRQLTVGARVHIVSKRELDCATIRYVGFTDFAPGCWVGLELDKPEGKNDGTVKGKQYFAARENHGLFVRPNNVKLVIPGEEFEFQKESSGRNFPASARLLKMQELSSSQRQSFRSSMSSLGEIAEELQASEAAAEEGQRVKQGSMRTRRAASSSLSNYSEASSFQDPESGGDWLYSLEVDDQGKGPLFEPRLVFALKSYYAIEVVCGAAFTAIVTREGRLFTFGENDYGQLGNGTEESTSQPCQIELPGCNIVKAVAAGAEHMLAISGDGLLYAWGNGCEGQLGLGEELYDEPNPHPRHVEAITNRVVAVGAGRAHSAAITEQGEIYTFGCGEEGQLGHGVLENSITPLQVESLGRSGADIQIVDVSCGASFTVVLTDSRTVYCWGNIQRQHSISTALALPRPVEAFVGAGVQTLCCNAYNVFAVARVENPQDGL